MTSIILKRRNLGADTRGRLSREDEGGDQGAAPTSVGRRRSPATRKGGEGTGACPAQITGAVFIHIENNYAFPAMCHGASNIVERV